MKSYNFCGGRILTIVAGITMLALLLVGSAEAAPLISIEDAVDNSALNFTSGGDAAWFGEDAVSYFGGDAAQSGRISYSENSWVQTNVTDIGTLSFYWKFSSQGDYRDFLAFYIDGVQQDSISGNVNWTQKKYSIGAGTHTLMWMYSSYWGRTDTAGWIDKIEFSPSLPLEEAVDNTAFNFTSGGDAPWFGQDAVSYFDGDAAQSGIRSNYQNTWIQANVTDLGALSFFWKVSSNSSHYLEFYIDNSLKERISGEVNWTKKSYRIDAGTHALKWNYHKDSNGSAGNDTSWIDKIEHIWRLNISNARTNKISYSLKENVTVSCIVRNETKSNISADNVTIKITKPDYSIEWFTMNEGIIGNYEGLLNNTSLFGKYNVSIYANKTGYIDGIAELSFEVLDEHDIAITKIDAPNSAFPNSVINVNATVRNSGLNDDSNIIVDLIVDEVNNSNRTISFLASGSSSTISFQWTAPDEAGTHKMSIYARPIVNETIKWNNRLNMSILVGNISLGTWTGGIDQGDNIFNSLDFVVSQNGINYKITGYNTQLQCYDHGAYWVSIHRNNINVPIINNSFNYNGEFRGTFTSSVKASGNFDISEGLCRDSGTWWASREDVQDSSAPQNIINLTNVTYAPTYINFTWTNPPDPDYHQVMLFLNGTFLTNVTAPQNYYNFTGLNQDTLYEVGTHTVDNSGNINQTWMNASARTAPETTNPSITVFYPNGGEILPRGTTQTIRWNYTGSPGSLVNITLLKGGVINRTINSSVPIGSSGNGSYTWLINSTQAPAGDYKVRIRSTTNAIYNDTSDSNFTILAIPAGYSYIYGKVINDSIGIADVVVSTNTSNTINTDALGLYSLLVPASTYKLTATREPKFYPNSSITVTVVAGTTVMQNIELIKKPTGNISGSVSK